MYETHNILYLKIFSLSDQILTCTHKAKLERQSEIVGCMPPPWKHILYVDIFSMFEKPTIFNLRAMAWTSHRANVKGE